MVITHGNGPQVGHILIRAELARGQAYDLPLDVCVAHSQPEPEGLRHRSLELRNALLALHKALIDSERVSYEKAMGKIQSPNQFLHLLTSDPWFAWLQPLSSLIVSVDEILDQKEPLASEDGGLDQPVRWAAQALGTRQRVFRALLPGLAARPPRGARVRGGDEIPRREEILTLPPPAVRQSSEDLDDDQRENQPLHLLLSHTAVFSS
ncbi:MAG: hypothetical protein AB1451_11815 [Nitrospirota bacterium]